MQVCGEYNVDAVGRQASLGERVFEMSRPLDAVDLLELRVLLVTHSSVNQHRPDAADDEGTHGQPDPVPLVGRRSGSPQRPGHDAEHRATIEPEETVGERNQLQVAERVPRDGAEGRMGGLRDDRRLATCWRLLELHQHAVRR